MAHIRQRIYRLKQFESRQPVGLSAVGGFVFSSRYHSMASGSGNREELKENTRPDDFWQLFSTHLVQSIRIYVRNYPVKSTRQGLVSDVIQLQILNDGPTMGLQFDNASLPYLIMLYSPSGIFFYHMTVPYSPFM